MSKEYNSDSTNSHSSTDSTTPRSLIERGRVFLADRGGLIADFGAVALGIGLAASIISSPDVRESSVYAAQGIAELLNSSNANYFDPYGLSGDTLQQSGLSFGNSEAYRSMISGNEHIAEMPAIKLPSPPTYN